MKVFFRFLFMSMLGLALVTSLDSCKDVPGCTDSEAENFNPDADVTDGTCSYARDKFLGTFEGNLSCDAPLPNDEAFTMVIAEGLTNNSEVTLNFQNLTTPLPELTARVDGSTLIIDPESVDIALDPNMPDNTTALSYSGEATIDAAGENLSGELRVLLVSLNITLKCDMTAVKQ